MLRGWSWIGLLCSLTVYHSTTGADEFLDFIQNAKPIPLIHKLNDEEGDDLLRPINHLATLPDGDNYLSLDAKQYNYDDNYKEEAAEGRHFRSKGLKTRGSKQNVHKKVTCFEHQAFEKDPPGCGNPICVVIDRKPRRFRSLCQFKTFLVENGRSEQINFVQKGDCYDIIDNDKKGGATQKPWSSGAGANQDCSACASDPSCNGKVTVIVDIQSFIKGTSSAPGGGTFKETNVRGSKMAALPFEFSNICEAMKVIESNENVNIKTQVVGFALGCVEEIFSSKGGDSCVYTEWFDHDTPCNSDKEVEKYCDHFEYLQPSYTGTARICDSEDIIETQHEGGSEITQIDAKMASEGMAYGRDNAKFEQELKFSKTEIACLNREQKAGQKLPPPFIYNDDFNTTCLDYKTRYCCRTTKMWRPQSIEEFKNSRMEPSLPIGLTATQIIRENNGAIIEVKIRISTGSNKIEFITLKFIPDGKVTGAVSQESGVAVGFVGTYTVRKLPDQTEIYTVTLYQRYNQPSIGFIEFRTHPSTSVHIAVSTYIKNTRDLIYSITQIDVSGETGTQPPPYPTPVEPTYPPKPGPGGNTGPDVPDSVIPGLFVMGPDGSTVIGIVATDGRVFTPQGKIVQNLEEGTTFVLQVVNVQVVGTISSNGVITSPDGGEIGKIESGVITITAYVNPGNPGYIQPGDRIMGPDGSPIGFVGVDGRIYSIDGSPLSQTPQPGWIFDAPGKEPKGHIGDNGIDIINANGDIIGKITNFVITTPEGESIATFTPGTPGTVTEEPGGGGGTDNRKYPEILTEEERYSTDTSLTLVAVISKGEHSKTIIATVVNFQITIVKTHGVIPWENKPDESIWVTIQRVIVQYSITLIVDSPPLATLFTECDWMDWVNIDYPDKRGQLKGEYELRDRAYNISKLVLHVCGNVPQHAHYVDAVTMEDVTPWHELRMDGDVYEVFKLTPFFGYACKDANGLKEYCQDMKVRYCCEKTTRATWGDWEPWSTCSVTCGGGKKTRSRACVANPKKKNSPNYIKNCIGQESWRSEETKRRYSTQNTDCNVEGCPEDHEFTHWSAWGRCSITCGKGFKKRTRSCLPAKHGGTRCPEKVSNLNLYEKIEECTQKDCEIFIPSLWGQWSTCSVTCGKGTMQRTRACISQLTYKRVDNSQCSNDPEYFSSKEGCHLGNCPVDGNWSNWGLWSACSQFCVSHPDSGNPEATTRAFRKRQRFCSNPMQSYGGKPCQRNPAYKFVSNTDSEEEETDCITEDSANLEINEEPVPWCPEQCIYTLWSEWSGCSATCLKLEYEMKGFTEKTVENVQYQINVNRLMPERQRLRVLVKEPRFGGSCPEQEANYDVPGSNNGSVIMQTEHCKLCKEHCQNQDNPNFADPNAINVKTWEPIEYAGKNCVGYCGVNCTWTDPSVIQDCHKAVQEYIEDKKRLIETRQKRYGEKPPATFEWTDCFIPQTMLVIADEQKKGQLDDLTNMWKEFLANLVGEKKEFRKFNRKLQDFINAIEDESGDDEVIYEMVDKYHAVMDSDIKDIERLTLQITKKAVNSFFVADGLVGGKDCVDDWKNKVVTSRKELLEKEGYTTTPYSLKREALCKFEICEVTITGPEPTVYVPKCLYIAWAEWGAWGKCDIKCGDEGLRRRRRDCINTCTKEKQPDEKCPPLKDSESDKQWTNEYTGPCTPCPPEVLGSWSTWSAWSFESAPACYEGEPVTVPRTRKRVCIASKEVETCSPTLGGLTKGEDVESMEIPLPKCGQYKKK